MLLLWDRRVLDRIDSFVGNFSVFCKWKGIEDGFELMCTGVYGPNDDNVGSNLWDELK